MRATTMLLVSALCGAAVWGAPAQFGFEDGAGPWQGVRLSAVEGAEPKLSEAKLDVVGDPDVVKVGQKALALSHQPAPGVVEGFFIQNLALAGTASVRMWLRCTATAEVVIAAEEADGSQYDVGLIAPPDEWQEVQLNWEDFTVAEDSQDENGELDAAQIVSVSVIDATGFLALLGQAVGFFDVPLGARTLYMDEVVFDAEPVEGLFAEHVSDLGKSLVLGDFERSLVNWLCLGTAELELVREKDVAAAGRGCLRMGYDLPVGKLVALLCGVDGARAGQAYGLRFKVRCSDDCTLVVNAEEGDKSRYNRTVELVGEDEWSDIELRFDEFELEGDSEDENDRLDLDQVTHVVFADVTGIMQGAARQAELWLDEVVLLLR